jgi:uncharacterized membrane protein
MTPAIEYALGALVFFGIGDLIYKRGAAAGVLPHQLLMVQSWCFTVLVALFGLVTGTLTFVPGSVWGVPVGLFTMIGFYNFAYSLRSGSISVNAPIFRLSFVITAILAIVVMGEVFNPFKAGGIALALAAVWLLLAVPSDGPRQRSRRSLPRVLAATLAIGVGNFIYKFGLRAGATPSTLIVTQGTVVVMLSTAFCFRIDGSIRPSGLALRYAPWAAIVLAAAFELMVEGIARGDASVVVPIAQMGFGVTALLGFVVLREAFTTRKGTGLLAALGALACFAYGQATP